MNNAWYLTVLEVTCHRKQFKRLSGLSVVPSIPHSLTPHTQKSAFDISHELANHDPAHFMGLLNGFLCLCYVVMVPGQVRTTITRVAHIRFLYTFNVYNVYGCYDVYVRPLRGSLCLGHFRILGWRTETVRSDHQYGCFNCCQYYSNIVVARLDSV